jgi:hypothetical protein
MNYNVKIDHIKQEKDKKKIIKLVIVIIWLMMKVMIWPKPILLTGIHCTIR